MLSWRTYYTNRISYRTNRNDLISIPRMCVTYSKSENVLMVSAVRLPQTDSNHAACSIPNVVSSSFEMPLIENMAATVARNVCSFIPTTAHLQYLTSPASKNPAHSSTPRALNAGNLPKMNQTGLHLIGIKSVILMPHFWPTKSRAPIETTRVYQLILSVRLQNPERSLF